jgi:hypothetical protein
MKWRGEIEVFRLPAVEKSSEVVSSAQTDGMSEGVGETAEDGESVEGSDGGAGADHADPLRLAIVPYREDELAMDELLELVQDPHLVLGGVSSLKHGASGDAVAGVDLDSARLEERSEDVDHVESLDLLGIPSRGGKEEDGRSHFAPAHDQELLTEALRVPAGS